MNESKASSTESLLTWIDNPERDLPDAAAAVIAFRDSEEGTTLLANLLSNYNAAKTQRDIEDRQWKYNLAMYNGMQYADFIRAGTFKGELMQKPKVVNKNRIQVNRLEAVVRTEMSRLTSQKPSAAVVPASSDDQDMFAAMAGEQVWEHLYREGKFHDVLVDAAFWTSISGNGFIKSYWDQTAYDSDSEDEGKICFESVTPFNLLVPDLRQTDIEKQPYVINVYTKTPEWLYMQYPKELDDVTLQASANTQNELLDETWLGLQGAHRPDPDVCMVYEFWIKPGGLRALPQGGHVVIAERTIVSYTPGKFYTHGQYPFAHIGHIYTGKFYRRSVLNSLNELQKEYNKTRTDIAEAANKMGKPQMAAQKGSISTAKWNNTTGLIIEYKAGYPKPEPIPLAEIPAYVQNSLDRVLLDVEDISGQHQVSKGQTPPGVTAATAISFLQEKDDSFLSVTYASLESAVEKIAKQSLYLAVQMWDMPRLVKIVGDDNSFDTMMLMGAEIKRGTDIRIEPGSALPTSSAARRAFVMDLMNAGFIPPEAGLEILEIGGPTKLMEQLGQDKRQAQRENIRLKSLDEMAIQNHMMEFMMDPPMMQDGQPATDPGPVISVNDWDNHQVHIEVHNRFRRSQAFEFLPDTVKAQFEAHVQMHKQAMAQEMIQDLLQSIPTDGTVPGASGVMDDAALAASEAGMPGSTDPASMGAEGGMPPEGGAPTEEAPIA